MRLRPTRPPTLPPTGETGVVSITDGTMRRKAR
jgi:hypothetical protein